MLSYKGGATFPTLMARWRKLGIVAPDSPPMFSDVILVPFARIWGLPFQALPAMSYICSSTVIMYLKIPIESKTSSLLSIPP